MPPEAALDWAAAAFGNGARVCAVEAMAGGTSAAIHALDVEDAAGRLHRAVLRRFVRAEWLAEEPDLAVHEATALEILAGSAVTAPQLLAVDATGHAADVPAVLMSRLPGRIEWAPRDVESFLAALAEQLPLVHAVEVPADAPLPQYKPYPVLMRRAPHWATQPEAWQRAIELLDGPIPDDKPCFIHRDYHPGNVLWIDGRVTGVIDWVNACIGSPLADVGHCRMNLARQLDQDAADRFLHLYMDLSGRADYHPYWDIAAAIGGLDESSDVQADLEVERFLIRAVSSL